MDNKLDTKINKYALYEPPLKHGLSNSKIIIPNYYIKN